MPNDATVTHDQAEDAAKRFIDAWFKNDKPRPQVCVPAQDDDHDIVLMRYIRQQRDKDSEGK